MFRASAIFREKLKGIVEMKEKTKMRGVLIHDAMFDAIKERAEGSIGLFIREACAEKLARDFGILFPAEVVRLKQGKRTDLINADEETREKMRGQAKLMREKSKPKGNCDDDDASTLP